MELAFSSFTLASNGASLAPRGQFLIGAKLFIGAPLMQNKVVLKDRLVLAMCKCKCMVFIVTRYMILKNGGNPTTSLVSTVLLIIEHKTWYQIKA